MELLGVLNTICILSIVFVLVYEMIRIKKVSDTVANQSKSVDALAKVNKNTWNVLQQTNTSVVSMQQGNKKTLDDLRKTNASVDAVTKGNQATWNALQQTNAVMRQGNQATWDALQQTNNSVAAVKQGNQATWDGLNATNNRVGNLESIGKAMNCDVARNAYLTNYPDVAKAGQDPWTHWNEHGKGEGRKWPSC
jgi:uncharacterized protein YoxC